MVTRSPSTARAKIPHPSTIAGQAGETGYNVLKFECRGTLLDAMMFELPARTTSHMTSERKRRCGECTRILQTTHHLQAKSTFSPATRTSRNSSSNPASKTNSGGTRESLQPRIVAYGCWLLAKLASTSASTVGKRASYRRIDRFPSGQLLFSSLWQIELARLEEAILSHNQDGGIPEPVLCASGLSPFYAQQLVNLAFATAGRQVDSRPEEETRRLGTSKRTRPERTGINPE